MTSQTSRLVRGEGSTPAPFLHYDVQQSGTHPRTMDLFHDDLDENLSAASIPSRVPTFPISTPSESGLRRLGCGQRQDELGLHKAHKEEGSPRHHHPMHRGQQPLLLLHV